MIRRAIAVPSTMLVVLALAGCSTGMKKTFGLVSNPPDAYQVGTLPPLALPPELGVLPPPNPGQAPTQQVDAAQQGEAVLSPGAVLASGSQALSPAGQALLDQAGPAPQADIRAVVNQNAAIASRPAGFVSSLMGAGPTAPEVVNAPAEERRLQENAALGKPVTNGPTPKERVTHKGFFAWIFDIF